MANGGYTFVINSKNRILNHILNLARDRKAISWNTPRSIGYSVPLYLVYTKRVINQWGTVRQEGVVARRKPGRYASHGVL